MHHGIFLTHHGTGGPAMHCRISTALNFPMQELASKLGGHYIHAACRFPLN